METHRADMTGRLILESGLIRFYTEGLDPQITMLIVNFIKFLSDYQQDGTVNIIPFPVK